MKQYLNVNLLWVVPATAAIAAFWLVSAKANYEFGLSLGDPIFGYASLASDVTKTVALFGVFAAAASRYWGTAAVLAAIWVACTLWSVASAVGFMSLHYATMTDERGKSAEDYKLISGQVARFEEQLAKVGAARPESVVQSEIDAYLRMPGVNGCAKIDGPVTQAVCPKVDALRAELGNSKSFAWLTGRIDDMRRELKITDRVTSVDPRAETLAALAGVTVTDTKKGMVGFFALLLELVTAMGFWAFWRAYSGRTQKPQEARTAAKPSEATETPAKALPPVQRPRTDALTKIAGVSAVEVFPDAGKNPAGAASIVNGVDTNNPREVLKNLLKEGVMYVDAQPKGDVTTDPDGPGTPANLPEIPDSSADDEDTDPTNVVPLRGEHTTKAELRLLKAPLRASKISVRHWLRDCMREVDGDRRGKPARTFLNSYSRYCEANGLKPLPNRAFSTALRDLLGKPTLRGKDGKRKSGQQLFNLEEINHSAKRRVA